MSTHGGSRKGSGRKPRAERFRTAIQRAEKRIADRLPELVDSLFDLANGVVVEETQWDGSEKVYKRAPDFKSASYLIDRVIGKPTQSVEVEGDVNVHDDGAIDAVNRKLAGLAATFAASSVCGESDAGGSDRP